MTTGQLLTWFEQEKNYRAFGWEQPVGLSSDVILDNVRYGGVVANGCHVSASCSVLTEQSSWNPVYLQMVCDL